jgi:hypothetical protein
MADQDVKRKRRSQIMLDDDLYQGLAQEAAAEGRSISSLVREAISQWLAPRRARGIKDSPFWDLVGTGHGREAGDLPVSENVDEYLYGREDRSRRHASAPSDDTG